MMLYSYLSTFIFAFLNDTSQKTRTVLNQEINIQSLKEAKPKKKKKNWVQYMCIFRCDTDIQEKVLFEANFF